MRRPAAAVPVLCSILALAACDSGSDDEIASTQAVTTAESTTTAEPPARETRDPLPDHPRDWERYANERGGYALLLPPGWNPKPDGPQTLVRSYNQLVAFTIAPDRSPEGLDAELPDYATATADELRGFADGFEPKGMRPLDLRYEAYEVYGSGRSRAGVDQDASVIVLRRDRVATLTVVLAANAKPEARESVRLARRAIATLRTRPPGQDGGNNPP